MIKEIEFGDEAIVFIRSRLAEGHTLSKYLLSLSLDDGRVVAHVPVTADDVRSARFVSGGLIERDTSLETTFAGSDGRVFRIVPVTAQPQRLETELELANFIMAYLQRPGSRYAVFEHALAAPGDPWLRSSTLRYFSYRSELYIFLTKADANVATIIDTIRRSSTYLFTGILTAPTAMPELHSAETVTEDVLQTLALSSEHILVGAYDGEGELIWSRTKEPWYRL
ncbi:MAG: hypothetical protein ACR2M0_10875 [Chloroflexia bacterium]